MPRKTDSGNPRDWLAYAKTDLDAVRLLVREQVAYPVCKSKLAEALEKGLKANLLTQGWRLEKTHDLQKLNDALAACDESVAEKLQSLVDDLAECYIEERYPGFDLEDPDWPSAADLLAQVSEYILELESKPL